MRWGSRFREYVSVAARQSDGLKKAEKIVNRLGRMLQPITPEHRNIVHNFWGKAWCSHFEAMGDYQNRLPRGRTYVRNGSVVDLDISRGIIQALVTGSDLYKIKIDIKPLEKSRWQQFQSICGGKIDSMLDLLQGRLSSTVMEVVSCPKRGLFPGNSEIRMSCSCPDWADLCKHLAAVLYGIGARFDQRPELLFELRGVDPSELFASAATSDSLGQIAGNAEGAAIADSELSAIFGIEVGTLPATASAPAPASTAADVRKKISRKKAARPKAASPKPVKRPGRKSPRPSTPSTKPRPRKASVDSR